MKILLLMPKDIYVSWPFANDFTRYITKIPAVTLPQLAASLQGYEVEIFDGLVEKIPMRNYLKKLKDFDIIGMKVESEVTSLNSELNIRVIKKINPDVKIILGGYHPTIFSKEWVERGVDFVVKQEGEITLKELISVISSNDEPDKVLGITFKKNGEVVENEDREFIQNLDEIPSARWDLINLKNYNLFFRKDGLTASVETARGCPYKCSFCTVPVMWRGIHRYKSVDRVLDEINSLYKLGVKQIAIIDDSFGINIERDKNICEQIIRKNFDISWGSFIRADTVLNHPDFVNIAGKSGLRFVYIGFESTSEELLDRYNKKYEYLSADDYKKVYEVLKKNRVFVLGLFVTGHPLEINSIVSSNKFCDASSYSNLRPIPKTAIFNDLIKDGVKIKDMFYHDRYLPAYEKDKRFQKNRTFLANLRNDIGLLKLRNLFFGSYVSKKFYQNLYLSLLKNLLSATPSKILNFITLINPFSSLEKRQMNLVRRYISDKFIEKIANKKYLKYRKPKTENR